MAKELRQPLTSLFLTTLLQNQQQWLRYYAPAGHRCASPFRKKDMAVWLLHAAEVAKFATHQPALEDAQDKGWWPTHFGTAGEGIPTPAKP